MPQLRSAILSFRDFRPLAAPRANRSLAEFVIVAALLLTLVQSATPNAVGQNSANQNSTDQNWANQNWTNYVRIGAYGLKSTNALEIVRKAQEDGVFGIEVDNDIPGRY